MPEKRKTALTLKFDKEEARTIELLAVSRDLPLWIDDEPWLDGLATLLVSLAKAELDKLKPSQPASQGEKAVGS